IASDLREEGNSFKGVVLPKILVNIYSPSGHLRYKDTMTLIGHLETVTAEADGSLDSVNLALVMALLYCLDVSFLEQGTEDREGIHALPLLTEKQYVAAVHSRLVEGQAWKLPGLQAGVQLAWALSLRAVSQLPQGAGITPFIAQAIVNFKINFTLDLDHLMILIGEFYSKDPFELELALEFWCPSESLQHTSLTGSFLGVPLQRPPHKQVVLSKFVRQMGDLLPATLYIPYLRMLKGLANGHQCSHYCFSLLKTNGAPHGENRQAVVSGSVVSWEHFFHSLMLYHENLRRDVPSADSMQYRHPPIRGITQRELEGLTAFLQLLTTIITWSENARLALCEHPQWTPVVVMLGLLQCSVQPVLKAQVLHALAAFGKSPEIAASLWQSLEYTQILQTVKVPGQRQAAGIEVELNEIESSCEEYPLTRAFCHLISTLVESALPVNLGAGLRAPGFQPYLDFLRDSVFLAFPTRAYRRPAEKWELAEAVLEVFHKLLREYEPQPADFLQEMVELQGEQMPAHKPPGHSLMFHLLNDSPTLSLCLSLLEEGARQLDTYAPFPGKKQLESAVLHCLCLLELALQKEVTFMDLLRESQTSLLVSPVEQLLQGVSAQSRRADHITNIARYLYHSSSNPDAAFQSAKILRRIARYPNIQARLVGDFTHDQVVSEKLMAGFVECLDSEENLFSLCSDSDPEKRVARIHHETKIHILNLLITSLELKGPNLGLYLLGYEVKKPVSSTNLQDPGVLGCPRSCLHAILSLLQRGSEWRTGPVLTKQAPQLAELFYQVIYQLCACPDTSGPTMRYLRTSQDFLFSHLQHLPFILPGMSDRSQHICLKSTSMWERLTAPEDCFSKLQRENLAIIESYGTALMEVVCRDACDGHEIGRMLALAVLDRVLSIDRQCQWLMYLCNSGYLRVLVESLRQDDAALQTLLTPQPPLLKPLYIYESKMALLTRVAKTAQGATELLRCGLVGQLVECQVFHMLPQNEALRVFGQRDPSGFIPSPLERYRQILLPTLRLMQVILTSTTTQHQQGAAQVLQWLIVHSDVIQSILHGQDMSMGALQELSLLTAIISKTALPGALEMGQEINSAALMELQGHIGRFQRQSLSLLVRLVGTDRARYLKQIEETVSPGDLAEKREEMEVAMQQICANIMEYCQTLLLQSSAEAQFSLCLFSPSASEPADVAVPSARVPSLGLVLLLLKNSATDFFRYHDSHRQSLNKLERVEQLPPEELKELCQGLVSGSGGVEKVPSVQRNVLAKRRLVQLVNNRAKLLALCSYTIETCLFVIWRHLEFYLLYCTPTDPKDSLLAVRFGLFCMRDSFIAFCVDPSGSRGLSVSRVSQQDLEQLQTDVANSFNEPLQRKLLEVEGLYSKTRSRHTFIQALTRRIRGLVHHAKG
uniref:Nuclear pore complex protein Nup205-like n=1 Tax=Sinocyclocheilus grahami TaxID=75366 RepID=A0A672LHB5_SINGR